jgi:hypothetical protein
MEFLPGDTPGGGVATGTTPVIDTAVSAGRRGRGR